MPRCNTFSSPLTEALARLDNQRRRQRLLSIAQGALVALMLMSVGLMTGAALAQIEAVRAAYVCAAPC